MGTSVNTVIETITPEKAREYFNTSIGEGKKPRPVSKTYIQSYADTMRKGRWMLNGVPIIFDTNGNLIDGCHRMLAVEKAGIPVAFEVRRGVSAEAFTTYDCGRHRTLGQLLAMQTKKNYNLAAAIVVVNERLISNGRLWGCNSTIKATNYDKYENYRRDPQGFDDAASLFCGKKAMTICPPSWVGGMYYYLTHTGGYAKDFVYKFFSQMTALETADNNTVELLRKRLYEERLKSRKPSTEVLFALIAKSWNAYVLGKKIKILKYNSEETLPRLLLKGDKS